MTRKVPSLVCHLPPYPDNEQELQVVAEQLAQALPPSEAGEPSELLENKENTRWALPPQLGQAALWLDWLIALSCSNLSLQSEQKYSYIGISPPPTGYH
jgi:hypothetical protein